MGIGDRLKFLARSYLNHARKKGHELFDQNGLSSLNDDEREMTLEEQVRKAVEKEFQQEEAEKRKRQYKNTAQRQQKAKTSPGRRRDSNTPNRPKTKNQQLAQHYANLELPPGASIEEVHKSWRKLILKYHPDRYAGDTLKIERATRITQIINSSYSALLEHLEDT